MNSLFFNDTTPEEIEFVTMIKFDVLKTGIFAREANICFKNIKFPRGNYQPIVPQQKHYCLNEEVHF